MLTAPEPEQVETAVPATAVGVVAQVIVLVDVGLVPEHAPLPVTVKVAVKLPNDAEGVNVARAGLAFCTQVPVPPLQVLPLLVPPEVAPVIGIAVVPVQVEIALPADAVGVALIVIIPFIVAAAQEEPVVDIV